VNGNVEKLASLLNQDSCTDDEAIELTLPAEPMYANPSVSDGRFNVPANRDVDDA
jgi:hypothetical protein